MSEKLHPCSDLETLIKSYEGKPLTDETVRYFRSEVSQLFDQMLQRSHPQNAKTRNLAWAPIPADHRNFGPAIVGWAGSPMMIRGFHDGTAWYGIGPAKDGTMSMGGIAYRLNEPPTHFLPVDLQLQLWNLNPISG